MIIITENIGSDRNKSINSYLKEPEIAKQLSYNLQKEKIQKEFPNAFFPRAKENLEEYVFYLLHQFPLGMVKKHYIEESIYYILRCKNPAFLSATKELYPAIGKIFEKRSAGIEGSIRSSIKNYFMLIPENVREEIFPIAKEVLPTNFFFLYYLTEYIKFHYYKFEDIQLTEIEKQTFLEKVDKKYNALEILKEEELKKIITKFLFTKLGHFRYCTSQSQLLLVDIILFFIKNNFISSQQLFYDREVREKWEFYDIDNFNQRLGAISFGIENAYQFVEPSTYKEIFKDNDLHKVLGDYIKKVTDYLKEQDYVRKLMK